jgi:Secretion system C-terminal sorting domain
VDMDEGAVLSKVVAVEVNTVKQLQVFPNPAHDKLSVVGDNLGNYTISDLSGRDILRGPLNSYESAIDVSTLPSGVYLLNANRSSVKFLKL